MSAGLAVSCEHIRHVYSADGEDVLALDDVSLSVPPGDSVALLGPSGSGKSTLMTLLAGLRHPSAGRLYIGDTDIVAMSERQLLRMRGNEIGVVVQNPGRNLLPYGTASDNILFAQAGAGRSRRGGLPTPAELLAVLGMSDLTDKQVSRMSGGEQQRLAVAVGMSSAPGVLLADEPTSQLDAPNRDRVVELLRRITSDFGTTVMIVTHDPDVAAAARRVATMLDGRLSEDSR